MAGTRRQSRARDTTSAHQRQRFTSRVGAIVPETATTASSKAVEIAGSADEASPRSERSPQPETPINRSTTAFCKSCDGKIGEFYNSWHRATSSYHSPALLGSYRSLLRISDQSKEVSDSTELAGCIIDLTCCPGCSNYLGFVVVDTPAGGTIFHGREFFKLQHIELRCETSSGKIIKVEPQENVAPDLVARESTPSSSPAPPRSGTATMELDTHLSSSHPLWGQSPHKEPQHQRQRSLSREPARQSLPSNSSYLLLAASRSPVTHNIATPAPASTTIPSPRSPQAAQLQSANTPGSAAPTSQSTSTVNGLKNGHSYPRDPHKVQLDAIERLQTQTSQNTSALAAQARTQMESADIVRQIESSLRHEFKGQLQRQDQELMRMTDVVNQLSRDLQECHQNMMALVQEVRANRAESARRPSEVAQPSYQDEALELMARRLGDVSHRTTDLETMREHVTILSGRVQRLESESPGTRQQHPSLHQAHPLHQSVHQSAHPVHVPHSAPSHPSQAPQFQTPARATSIPQAVQHREQPATVAPTENAQRHEPAPIHNGWATVNAGVKRVFENGMHSPPQRASLTPGDPKRPKLTTGDSNEGPVMTQHPPEPSQILPSQAQSIIASQPMEQPGSYPGPHVVPHPGAHPAPPSSQPYLYGTQGSPGKQNWHTDPQHMIDVRPARGRGSRGGRGPGSRGGRTRKSMQGQHHVGTPEWERGWSAVPDSHGSPTSLKDYPAHPARGIVRRGGGGGTVRGGAMLGERSGEWTPEIGPRSVFQDHDSPIEVKKTRSKPIRNEEGILVRKDGRPDRRSQSSAANLRKVHARKEEQQREAEAGSTPTGLHASISTGPDTPSPTARVHAEPHLTDSVRKKHNAILGRIFPDGLDDSRKQHDYAHQVFNEDRDHTAHPRTQVSRTSKAPAQVKKEQIERNEVAKTQVLADGDVEMGDEDSPTNHQANEDSQTPVANANDMQ
ncbi:uncharacterized protein M421DRAFT_417216 [Didymella exigua CBS 183.55]|uniref:Mis18 domain-containing protein n=1 Tax=Didymella exigua CBS 183.55 TaxID=1150837 RepID=A0A6A5S4R3_9PLEO|nr:uncharacterized protein M421DRAFT_417216 [Didymella exigua CBS 183.55]KAF1932497.1 hypothetical protein M421DRAFT_417216 [Didymella exigua CBS 183.55]